MNLTNYFLPKDLSVSSQFLTLNSKFILFKEELINVKDRIELDKLNPEEFYYEDARLTDKNFKDYSLLPGVYTIKNFKIPNGATLKECIQFVLKEKCILAGPYAIAATYKYLREFISVNTYTISIGKITGVLYDDKIQSYLDHRYKNDKHIWRFDIGDFSRGIPLNYNLICLYKK